MGNFLLEQIYFLVPILIVIYLVLFATKKITDRYREADDTHIQEQNSKLIKEYIYDTTEVDKFLSGVDRAEITISLATQLTSQGYSIGIRIPPITNLLNDRYPKTIVGQLLTKSIIQTSLKSCFKHYNDLSEEIKRQNVINLSAASAFAELALTAEVKDAKSREAKGGWLNVIMKHSDKKHSLGLIICLFRKMKGTDYERFYLDNDKLREFYQSVFISHLKQGISYDDCICNFNEYLELVANYRSISNATADDFLPRHLWRKDRLDPRKLMDELNRLRGKTYDTPDKVIDTI
jgi:hypothetical protein